MSLPVTEWAEACPPSPGPPPPIQQASPWYAVYVHTRQERAAEKRYAGLGFETWLPLYREKSRWKDREVTLDRALIPGYLFVRIADTAKLIEAIGIIGVIRVLGRNVNPTVVPDAELSAFRAFIECAGPVSRCPYVAGERVTVRKGPLAGRVGVVVRLKNEFRLVVSLEMLKRSVSVEIDVNCL